MGGIYEYFKVNDEGLDSGSVRIDGKNYWTPFSPGAAGRLNLDFEETILSSDNQSIKFYPLQEFNASYSSIVMQDKIIPYDDIYEYIDTQPDDLLKEVFYTTLGRERASKYNSSIKYELKDWFP